MNKIILFWVFIFTSCQPYGKVTSQPSPCKDISIVDISLHRNQALLDSIRLFEKIKVINTLVYIKELQRLTELSKTQNIEKSADGVKNISTIFRDSEHFLRRESDYVALVELLEKLKVRTDFNEILEEAGELYRKSRNDQAVVGNICP
jgi:hypothetical protein